MTEARSDWLQLIADSVAFGTDVMWVLGLRTAVVAQGGARAETEMERMATEKLTAHTEFAAKLMKGGIGPSPEAFLSGALSHYGPRVAANRRRLGGSR